MQEYYEIISKIPRTSYQNSAEYCITEFHKLVSKDFNQIKSNTSLMNFVDFGFTYLMEANFEDEIIIEDRVLLVCGYSRKREKVVNDRNRMQSFPKRPGYDKGHFVPYSLGGGIDQNLFYQSPNLNRGRSIEGKLYRTFERYILNNEGVFFFNRPIYTDNSYTPTFLDFGILTKEYGLLYNRFSNEI